VKGLLRPRSVALASVIVAAPLWSACSTGVGGAHAAAAPASLCQTLNGIFSDGPDPDADPVGYALSQIKGLQAIHTADHAVSSAVRTLVAADQALVSSNGSDHAATSTIKKADARINTSCPGVAS